MNAIANSSSKPIGSHPSNPYIFLMGNVIGNMLKYSRTQNLFLLCVILSRGRHESQKCSTYAHFEVYLHIFTNSFNPSQTTKLCSVRFFRLQKLVVSPLSITKICRVRIFLLQKFVVSAFSDYKTLYCPLCLFVVSAFFYNKSL